MRILHDSTQSFFRTPFGALRQHENCRLRLQVPVTCQTNQVFLVLENDGVESTKEMVKTQTDSSYDTFSVDFCLAKAGLYHYYFFLKTKETDFRLFRFAFYDTNMEEGDKWQITCYPEDFETPESLAGSVMYQIFPDRFAKEGDPDLTDKMGPFTVHAEMNECPDFRPDEKGDILTNDFYGGNFKGIEKKLPYLVSLGVGIIYLNPICKAFSNHRYDTADYLKPDPMLGTEQDFKELCDACHRNGIRVVLDGVFSHTGSDSLYFDAKNRFGNGAVSSPETSPYRKWYHFGETDEDYDCWWGVRILPCVDELQPDYLEYVITGEHSVVSYWMALGADGFRLDVADELPDAFIALLRSRMKAINPEALLIGEVWEDASNKESYGKRRGYFTEGELDSVMNYPFRSAILDLVLGKISPFEFGVRIQTIAENYPSGALKLLMNSLSTHDTPRILTLLSGVNFESKEERASARLTNEQFSLAFQREKMAALLQFVLPGLPCIYYGDEIGMEGYEDPLNRRFFQPTEGHPEVENFYRQLLDLKRSLKIASDRVSFVRHEKLLILQFLTGEKQGMTVMMNPREETVRVDCSGTPVFSENVSDGQMGPYGFLVMKNEA